MYEIVQERNMPNMQLRGFREGQSMNSTTKTFSLKYLKSSAKLGIIWGIIISRRALRRDFLVGRWPGIQENSNEQNFPLHKRLSTRLVEGKSWINWNFRIRNYALPKHCNFACACRCCSSKKKPGNFNWGNEHFHTFCLFLLFGIVARASSKVMETIKSHTKKKHGDTSNNLSLT